MSEVDTDPASPVEHTQACPFCNTLVTMEPYDIGSGPELSCPACEACWGAAGQALQRLPESLLDPSHGVIEIDKVSLDTWCKACGALVIVGWPGQVTLAGRALCPDGLDPAA